MQTLITPGPGEYKFYGDFDFKDPQYQGGEHQGGKNPKFHYGIKTNVKTSNQDVPGPGTYETDMYPMN